jgi:anti-sigma regulatory factor (Ser/Thr protein kinase)
MDNAPFSSYKIEERSYVSLVKRDIQKKVAEAGFSSQRAGEIDIIVSELTSNIIKHTSAGGEVIFRISEIPDSTNRFFEIFSIDNAQGSNDIQRFIKDGLSSTNTLGQGLGAINRLSDIFQIYSQKGWGTVVYSRKYQLPIQAYKRVDIDFQVRTIQENMPGEKVCGDGFLVKKTDTETRLFVGDGLGHGQHAHDAINKALEAFDACDEKQPVEILRFIHDRVKKTRGLVGSVAILDHEERVWRMAGIGNIATRLYNGLEYKTYMPYNGIIGLNLPRTMNNFETGAERFQTVIMTSDGIKTKWDLSKYPSILKYDPAIIAGALFKDHARHTDDMTVLVGKLIL